MLFGMIIAACSGDGDHVLEVLLFLSRLPELPACCQPIADHCMRLYLIAESRTKTPKARVAAGEPRPCFRLLRTPRAAQLHSYHTRTCHSSAHSLQQPSDRP